MLKRRFFSNQDSREIIALRAMQIRIDAERMPPSVEKDRLLKQARELEVGAVIDNWVSSSGLQRPT
ncbi:MAG: hypothetical protein CFE29_03550 [Bradyrhizobiaceae bacterium PARB1]|jgi:hypothetical protein|nr:MAG: hypothetical protein CFE29_03550 [Bradyrhizobiaceae bacterium PARB1]